VVTAYYKQVGGAVNGNTYGYVFPCSATLPDLVIGISTYKATVPGSYLNYAPTESGGSTCFGGLQPDTGLGVSIFGLTFIKSQFVVFKGTTSPTLGFAKKA
jgi:aspergillopepsin I